MISGDNLETAVYMAKLSGILQGEDEKYDKVCMMGKEFREAVGGVRKVMDHTGNEKWEVVNKQNFKPIAQRLKVLARSTPEDKFAMIVGLKDLGANVAVTADGINDALALKNANVGFCMGSGCVVAKESSDIVFLDDNFKSVFRATQWGRNIYDNVRKFIQFQITINISALLIVFLSGATLGDSPFNVIQLLWVNMVMDTLAALALATEPPHPTELKQGKIKKSDRVFLPEMWRAIFSQVIYQQLVMIILLYGGPAMFGIKYDLINTDFYVTSNNPLLEGTPTNKLVHYTFLFNTFMMMNLFNELNCRKLGVQEYNIFERFFNNKLFLLIICAQFAAQWFIVAIGTFGGPGEIGATVFRTTPLPFTMVLASVLFGCGSLIVASIFKATPPAWLEKIKVEVDEDGVKVSEDFISKCHSKISGGLKRSETERLLDI
jgi:magnesium-transporting ATPase (P-type)